MTAIEYNDAEKLRRLITKAIVSGDWQYNFDSWNYFRLCNSNNKEILGYSSAVSWICFNPDLIFRDHEDHLSFEQTIEITRKFLSEYFSIPCTYCYPGKSNPLQL